MIIAIDTETRGLDATKYVTGCLISEENPDKPEIYDNKEDLWKRILELGKKQTKNKKTLSVYAHNHSFDFYAYAKLDDPNIKWFSHNPFINAYKDDCGKEIIKFLDTMAIYPMNLAKMGSLHGLVKGDTPNVLKTGKKPSKKELERIKEYMVQDAHIVLETIIKLKGKMKTEGIKVRRLYTIGQIAINCLINAWRNDPLAEHVFWNAKEGEIHKTWKPEIIHEAYRGGRVQAIQTGKFKGATRIDINNMYAWSAAEMRFPQLKGMCFSKNHGLPEKDIIGIAKCMMFNKKCDLGVLPVRTPSGSYYPRKGKYLIGTWTLQEIHKAIKEGYELITLEWSYTYKKANYNPFTKYMETMYEKRKSGDAHDKYFYKAMMLQAIGKLAQSKTNQEIVIDSVEKTQEYLDKNYKILRGIDYNYIYQRDLPKVPKKYYCPILPTIINADARLRLYEEMKKIPREDLLYCDTDSITLLNWDKHKAKFKIGLELGEFKVEEENVDCEIIARKTYRLADEIKISGMHKHEKQSKEWEEGVLTEQKMITIKSDLTNIAQAGKFKTETSNLKERFEKNKATQEMLDEEVVLIDENVTDITHYLPYIQKIIK